MLPVESDSASLPRLILPPALITIQVDGEPFSPSLATIDDEISSAVSHIDSGTLADHVYQATGIRMTLSVVRVEQEGVRLTVLVGVTAIDEVIAVERSIDAIVERILPSLKRYLGRFERSRHPKVRIWISAEVISPAPSQPTRATGTDVPVVVHTTVLHDWRMTVLPVLLLSGLCLALIVVLFRLI